MPFRNTIKHKINIKNLKRKISAKEERNILVYCIKSKKLLSLNITIKIP